MTAHAQHKHPDEKHDPKADKHAHEKKPTLEDLAKRIDDLEAELREHQAIPRK